MHSHTKITLTGKDQVGCDHKVIVEDCPENPDWFNIKPHMAGDDDSPTISIPKIFIPALTEAINKFY